MIAPGLGLGLGVCVRGRCRTEKRAFLTLALLCRQSGKLCEGPGSYTQRAPRSSQTRGATRGGAWSSTSESKPRQTHHLAERCLERATAAGAKAGETMKGNSGAERPRGLYTRSLAMVANQREQRRTASAMGGVMHISKIAP